MPPSQILTKRHAEQQLMPPPPPPKRIKRPSTVLDEDIYTNALSQIIARDFFPGLLESQLKGEYLEAVESGDRAWMRAARGKLEGYLDGNGSGATAAAGAGGKPVRPRTSGDGYNAGETPTGSAWGGDTPMSVATATATPTPSISASTVTTTTPKEIPDVSNMGLLSFQANYTSEDNESFNKLMDRQNAKHRDRHAWIWSGNKIPSARQIAHQTRENKRIAASGVPEQNGGGNDGGGEGVGEKALVKSDLDARPAKPDAWNARPENSLMFLPDSIEDTHETVQQRAEAESKMGPRRVLYQNTRLPALEDATENGNQPLPSPAISAIKDAIAGRPRTTDSEAGSQAGFSGGETPRINGYAFVDEDEPPSSSFTETKEEDDLRILGPADKTPNPFRIPQNRKREDLHHRMVNRMERTKRAERANVDTRNRMPVFASSPRLDLGLRSPATPGGSVASGTPSTHVGGGKMLTPAAQKLLKRVGSTPQRSGSGPGSRLRNMWTPTPKKK